MSPGIVAAHEHDDASQHRRNEGGHRLPEHVAQGQQVQEPDRAEWFRVPAILQDLFFDRDDVREHVAVRDHHALRLGRRARREDDLRHIVTHDRDGRRGVCCTPVELVDPPHRRVAQPAYRGNVLANEHHAGGNDASHAHEKVGGRAVVNRHDDRADQQTAPERHNPLRAVFAEDDDLVAFGHPCRSQSGGERLRGATHVRIAERARAERVVVHDELAVGRGDVVEEVDQRVAAHS